MKKIMSFFIFSKFTVGVGGAEIGPDCSPAPSLDLTTLKRDTREKAQLSIAALPHDTHANNAIVCYQEAHVSELRLQCNQNSKQKLACVEY